MPAPTEIRNLVERFEQNRESYTSAEYNETQLRREFLDPFFTALGWDVDNKAGYAEAYKDVVHEDAIKIGTATKAPDYSFRIGGIRKFFVEAKKPSVNVKEDIPPAYQVRRYAWSAKLPLSILTDFEELAVYDCRIKPKPADKPAVGRILYFQCTEYVERWDELAAIFSREAVLKGSFDKYVESTKGKRGTAEVDDAFLEEIESWREVLAKNIAANNHELSVRDLNFAVQRIIDRIIFLRICEDRGIETYGSLQRLVNGKNVYARLCEIFYRADEKYNSGLFHFQKEKDRREPPDEFTPGLEIEDDTLKEIIRGLYYPDSSYEFSVLPADILGQVYEQFLGKVIRLTAGHQAKVEEKPEVKKAGGVYYTPTYIVDYIVKNTVGKILEELSAKEKDKKILKSVSKLRILDPACGSGSFLIGAYQYLLNWHRDWYIKDGTEKWTTGKNPTVYQGMGGDWRLTAAERKRILLNNIYGVDIDPQAVEVTKLSLLLKVLEGENEQTISKQLKIFNERALPDLAQNIKCGNSLIGPDFYEGRQLSLMDDDERIKINAFDWNSEFKEIMEGGGFDAVIGNPPYVRQEDLGEKSYFGGHFKTFKSTADLYVLFIEKALSITTGSGLFAMIISNKWLRAAYGDLLREFLATQSNILQVVDFSGLPVFENVTVRPIILVCSTRKTKRQHLQQIQYLPPPALEHFRSIRTGSDVELIFGKDSRKVILPSSHEDGWAFGNPETSDLVQRLKANSTDLVKYVSKNMYRGIITGFNKAFMIDEVTRKKLISEDKRSGEIIKPLVVGKNIRRYSIDYRGQYLIRTHIGISIGDYPAILKHLKQFQSQLEKRWDQGNHWWELRSCEYYDKFEQPKIIYPDISIKCRFALDNEGYFSSNTTYFIPSSDLYLLGLLNSKVGQFYFEQVCAGLEGGGTTYLRFFGQYLEGFPVRMIDYSLPEDKSRHERMLTLVKTMLDLHQKLAAAKTEQDQTMVKRQIEATDRQIDELVYELYGLTEEERKIVEGN